MAGNRFRLSDGERLVASSIRRRRFTAASAFCWLTHFLFGPTVLGRHYYMVVKTVLGTSATFLRQS